MSPPSTASTSGFRVARSGAARPCGTRTTAKLRLTVPPRPKVRVWRSTSESCPSSIKSATLMLCLSGRRIRPCSVIRAICAVAIGPTAISVDRTEFEAIQRLGSVDRAHAARRSGRVGCPACPVMVLPTIGAAVEFRVEPFSAHLIANHKLAQAVDKDAELSSDGPLSRQVLRPDPLDNRVRTH